MSISQRERARKAWLKERQNGIGGSKYGQEYRLVSRLTRLHFDAGKDAKERDVK